MGDAYNVKVFLEDNNIQMPAYTNPADFLIKLAVDPRLLARGLTRRRLADINKTVSSEY